MCAAQKTEETAKTSEKNVECRKELNSPLGTALLNFTEIGSLPFWGQYVLKNGIAAIYFGKCLRDCISYAELSQVS